MGATLVVACATGAALIGACIFAGSRIAANTSNINCCSSTNSSAKPDKKLYDESFAKFSKGELLSRQTPGTACFAPGTPPEIIDAFHDAMENAADGAWPPRDGVGVEYQLNSRWTGSQGDPRVIRWSFVPDGLSISNGIGEGVANSNLFATMNTAFGGNTALWISKIEACFTRWSQLCGLRFQRVTNGTDPWDDGAAWGTEGSSTRGDVRIAMKFLDGNGGVLAYNYFPQNGDMVIDSGDSARWANASGDYLQLRNVTMHEHGHGSGLNHVCPVATTKLMEPYLATNFDGPQHDDIRANQRHYGDPYEPDNTAAEATDLGALAAGGNIVLGPVPAPDVLLGSVLSIDANGELDFFKFTTSQSVKVSITVTPIGTTYGSNSQNTNCTQTATVNSLTIANLAVDLIGTNGTTVLASASSQPAGVAETISEFNVSTPGTYFVRVSETNTPTQSQLYHLNLSATASNNAPVLDFIGDRSVDEETPLTFDANATDPDAGQVLTYSLVGAPAGATIDPSTGVFNWTPTEAQGPNQYTFDVKVEDNGTPIMSDSETITITVNESAKVIRGNVALQNWTAALAGQTVSFDIRIAGSEVVLESHDAVLDANGDYMFVMNTMLEAGTYDMAAKSSHWLRKNLASVNVGAYGANGQNYTLINGDYDGDNEITLVDFGAVSASFGTADGDTGFDPNADLDGDLEVTLVDIGIVSGNFGLSGD